MINQGDNVVQAWQSKLLEQGVAQLGQAMLIVSSRGDVVFCSKSAQQFVQSQLGIHLRDGHLVAEMPTDNQRLQEAILSATDKDGGANTIGLYIHREGSARPLHLTISKILRAEDERRHGHHVLILIKDLNMNQAFWAVRLKDEYKLSSREMECVALLSEGRELRDVADFMGIGIDTVRQYVKKVYKKMGVHKQHELVSLALEYRRNR